MNLAIFLLLFQLAGAAVLNESVGRVGETVLTSREVRLSNFIEQVLIVKSNQKKSTQLAKDTTALLLEVVVVKEAENFSLGQVSEKDLEKALGEVKKSTGFLSLQKELGVTEIEVKTAIQRKLNAQSFIEFKTNSLTSTVTEEEARIYFEANPNRFKGAQFESLKENIKSFLSQQQLNERLKSWFELLKRKYKVQNYLLES